MTIFKRRAAAAARPAPRDDGVRTRDNRRGGGGGGDRRRVQRHGREAEGTAQRPRWFTCGGDSLRYVYTT